MLFECLLSHQLGSGAYLMNLVFLLDQHLSEYVQILFATLSMIPMKDQDLDAKWNTMKYSITMKDQR